MHIRNLKQAINHGLVLKEVHRVTKFNQKAWLKPYIDVNTELRKNAKMILKKIFQVMDNAVFRKSMKNVGSHRALSLHQPKQKGTT